MSELTKAAEYIGETRLAILGTVNNEGFPVVRSLASFANDGLNVYLSTSKDSSKVEQLRANDHATLLFQQEGQELSMFRNVALTGTAKTVCSKCGEEYEKAVKLLSERNPRFRERALKGELDRTTILKFETKTVKFLDFSRGAGPSAVQEIAVV